MVDDNNTNEPPRMQALMVLRGGLVPFLPGLTLWDALLRVEDYDHGQVVDAAQFSDLITEKDDDAYCDEETPFECAVREEKERLTRAVVTPAERQANADTGENSVSVELDAAAGAGLQSLPQRSHVREAARHADRNRERAARGRPRGAG
jgi:hypothetical protein